MAFGKRTRRLRATGNRRKARYPKSHAMRLRAAIRTMPKGAYASTKRHRTKKHKQHLKKSSLEDLLNPVNKGIETNTKRILASFDSISHIAISCCNGDVLSNMAHGSCRRGFTVTTGTSVTGRSEVAGGVPAFVDNGNTAAGQTATEPPFVIKRCEAEILLKNQTNAILYCTVYRYRLRMDDPDGTGSSYIESPDQYRKTMATGGIPNDDSTLEVQVTGENALTAEAAVAAVANTNDQYYTYQYGLKQVPAKVRQLFKIKHLKSYKLHDGQEVRLLDRPFLPNHFVNWPLIMLAAAGVAPTVAYQYKAHTFGYWFHLHAGVANETLNKRNIGIGTGALDIRVQTKYSYKGAPVRGMAENYEQLGAASTVLATETIEEEDIDVAAPVAFA